jgi:hypothetical protein
VSRLIRTGPVFTSPESTLRSGSGYFKNMPKRRHPTVECTDSAKPAHNAPDPWKHRSRLYRVSELISLYENAPGTPFPCKRYVSEKRAIYMVRCDPEDHGSFCAKKGFPDPPQRTPSVSAPVGRRWSRVYFQAGDSLCSLCPLGHGSSTGLPDAIVAHLLCPLLTGRVGKGALQTRSARAWFNGSQGRSP